MENILKLYNEENLGKITARVIQAYRSGNRGELEELARGAGLNPNVYAGKTGKLFKRLMVTFHPDRLAHFHGMIRRYGAERNELALKRMEENIRLARTLPSSSSAMDWTGVKTHYQPDGGMIRPGNERWDDYREGLSVREETAEEWGFLEAVRAMMYGNLFSEFLPKDLLYLEGMLDLPWNEIEDLTGIEYCRNLTGLNLEGNCLTRLDRLEDLPYLETLYLAHNRIDDLTPLGRLAGLKTLDLAFNDVEKVDVLLNLPFLEYVNLLGNPIAQSPALSALRERCLVITEVSRESN